ncbi:MAG: hypothetical protein QOG09_1595 [Solirubrobacterales bacterium]|jgi:plastocyanin|nr:hypothetical protein [Solirubrobacterales bacterium]MDX6663493.1 hypothetical protein [Solirubrobacterales bacterium]
MKKELLALGGVAALAAVGCGGGNSYDSSGSSTSTPASTTSAPAATGTSAAAGSVKVSETDFKLSPSNPTVKPGTVTFNVSNNGATVHSLEVTGTAGEQRLASPLQPGQSAVLKAKLTKPGTYTWYCPIANHKSMGMRGTITVAG